MNGANGLDKEAAVRGFSRELGYMRQDASQLDQPTGVQICNDVAAALHAMRRDPSDQNIAAVLNIIRAFDKLSENILKASKVRLLKARAKGLIIDIRAWADELAEAAYATDIDGEICLTPADWAAREIPPEDLLLGSVFSTTTRSQLSADTGLGKTMFGLARAYAIRLGARFLRWQGHRQARVLYLDGEMPRQLIKDRLAMAAAWFGAEPVGDGFYLLSREDVENMPPLDTPAGARWLLDFIDQQCDSVDDITFDNIASLTASCLKEEDGARALNDFQRDLTKQKIGQNWLHHTGHDPSRGYGAKLREWHLDTVMVGEKLDRPGADVAFTLKFSKCRRRTPDNRADFEDLDVVLEHGAWTTDIAANSTKKKTLPASAQICRNALAKALAEFGTKPPPGAGANGAFSACTDVQWRNAFNNMIPRDDPNPRATWKRGTERLIADRSVSMGGGWAWFS